MDLDRLRKHYASLSDEALLEIDSDELVQAACVVLDAEIAARGLAEAGEEDPSVEYEVGSAMYEVDWADSAATVFSYSPQQDEEDGQRAVQALTAAGIPYDIEPHEEPGKPLQLELHVPGAALLAATSILDRDVFNEHLEQGWREHFASLTDEEIAAVDIRVLTAGWADRIERLTRAYTEERKKREE